MKKFLLLILVGCFCVPLWSMNKDIIIEHLEKSLHNFGVADDPSGYAILRREFSEANKQAWFNSLTELSQYISQHSAKTGITSISSANKKLFEDAMEKLNTWSFDFFDASKALHAMIVQSAALSAINADAFKRQNRVIKDILWEIHHFKSQLKPGWSDYAITKEIKALILKAMEGFEKLVRDVHDALQQVDKLRQKNG